MKRYLPSTADDTRAMLQRIGVSSVDELFADIPAGLRLNRALNLPAEISEPELLDLTKTLADANTFEQRRHFLGAGAYNHFIPTIIPYLTHRGEFSTAYTPYQPEVSQGTLQAIFEFQTLICQLTGMEVANASMYDGATALAEAAIMASRVNNRQKIVIAGELHPNYRQVVKTYTKNLGLEIVELPSTRNGVIDLEIVSANLDERTSAVIVQQPNFLGFVEPVAQIREAASSAGALMICAVTEALSLGLLKSPGEQGADIVVGEAQSFGMPLSYGGPYAGFFATREDRSFLRNLPGRLVGATTDKQNRRGFVLTLATREQHIKREKATSNICSNQALCALTATIYLSALGKSGLREVAVQNTQKAHFAREMLLKVEGVAAAYDAPFFNEFVISVPFPAELVLAKLHLQGFVGGLNLGTVRPELANQILVCVTEVNRSSDISAFSVVLAQVLAGLA